MIDKVESYALKHNMFKDGEKILIALSGGPDSVCMMHILVKLRDKYGFDLYAAHINHMMRGDESDGDESYVKNICDKYGIKLFIKRVDINKICSEEKISSELAGRRERYNFFEKIYREENLDKIAVAHNSNDQAETILMRIIRGSGLEGVTGISPVRDGIFIRPILCLSRYEVESYCEENKLEPRIDKTNLENIYHRNKIRNDIIPYIKENFNNDIINTINRFGAMATIDNDYIEKESSKLMKKYYLNKDEVGLLNSNLFNEHEAIVCRIIKKSLTDVSGESKNFEMKHIYAVISLSKGQTGKNIELPNNILVSNIYGDIRIEKKNQIRINEDIKDNVKIIDTNLLDDGVNVDFDKYSITMKIIDMKDVCFKNNNLIKYFDCDKINSVKIRYRRNGDKLIPFGMTKSKKLKDIFINLKIPKNDRDTIPIIEFNEQIGWVVGVKMSNVFRITNTTSKILEISFEERIQ